MDESILHVLPESVQGLLLRLPETVRGRLEEIRIREGRPLEIVYAGSSAFIAADGAMTAEARRGYVPVREDCARLLERLTRHSLYTFEEELRRGYITIAGGHRIGLAGRAVLEQGRVKLLKQISGFNIRLARQITGVGLPLLPYLYDAAAKRWRHTLLISPPQQGKTTLIRDMARLISGGAAGCPASKVGIVDERSEIAASVQGVPSFDVGPRTDVLDCCPKAEGMMMMIRSMSPDVLIVDEIGRPEDALAISEAVHAGISVIATAHGRDVDDARRRPVLGEMLAKQVFQRFLVLSRSGGGTLRWRLFDEAGGEIRLADAARTGGGVRC